MYFHLLKTTSLVIQEKRGIISTFARLYSSINNTTEPSFNKLLKFASTYPNEKQTLIQIQDSFLPSATRIVHLMLELKPDLERMMLTGQSLAKLAPLSLCPQTSGIKAPKQNERYLRGLIGLNRLYEVFLVGVFCCFGEILKQNCVDFVKGTIGYGFIVPVYIGSVFNIAQEFDVLFKSNSKFGKFKNSIGEATLSGISSCGALHFERREYLIHQLKQIIHLCDDCDMLCGDYNVFTINLDCFRCSWICS